MMKKMKIYKRILIFLHIFPEEKFPIGQKIYAIKMDFQSDKDGLYETHYMRHFIYNCHIYV